MLALAAPLLLANPIEQPITWIVDSITSYLGQNVSAGTVTNPLTLLVPLGDPNTAAAQSPLGKVVPGCDGNGSNCDFETIAGTIRAVGYVLFAIVLLARMLKLAASGRLRSPEHLLLDLGPKLVLGMLAIQYFDQALNVAGKLSMWGVFLLEDALLTPLHLSVKNILTAFPTQGLGFLLMPVLYLLVWYLVLLVVTSRLVLLLGALVSPLGIPIALYNEQGRLAGTWTRMIVSGLLVPVVAGIGAAGSLALAWLVHQIAGNGVYIGSYLGALTGECGLFFTAFAATAMFRDAVKQGMAGARGSFEGAHMESLGRAPGDVLDTSRRGVEVATGAGMAAAGLPMGAALAAKALKGGEAGSEDGAASIPRLPGGTGGTDAGSQPMLPAGPGPGSRPTLPASGVTNPRSPVMLPEPPGPDVPLLAEARFVRRRIDGGKVIWELERRQLVQYATRLSETPDDTPVRPQLADRVLDA